MSDEPLQYLIAALSIAAAVIFTVAWLIAFRVNGKAPFVLRIAMLGLVLYAWLRVYSTTTFIWASEVDHDALMEFRYGVFVVVGFIITLGVTLLVYYIRRLRG